MRKFYAVPIITVLAFFTGCGSSPAQTNPFSSFEPSYAIFSTFDLDFDNQNNVVGSVLFSSDPNACAAGVKDGMPYMEISLFATSSNAAANLFTSGTYPISSTPVLSTSQSGSYNAAGVYWLGDGSTSYALIDSSSQTTGNVSVIDLSSDSATITYDISVPGVGANARAVHAVFCEEYGIRLQQAVDAPMPYPG